MDRAAQERQVDENYEAFLSRQAELLRTHPEDHVLIRDREMISFHQSAGAALEAGRAAFPDGIFSVQQVRDEPIDLGFFSHAVDSRIA